MADLKLVSTRKGQLKPLVEAALANELRLLEAGIHRTEQRILELRKNISLELKSLFPVTKTTSWQKRWTSMNGLASSGCWHGCGKKQTR